MLDATGVDRPSAAPLLRIAVDGRWAHDRLDRRIRSFLPLLFAWTKKEYSIRYRQSVLGPVWSVVQPLAVLATFGAILSGVLHVSSEGEPYVAFAWSGLAPWTFAATVISSSATAVMSGMGVASKVYFPREVMPLAQVCAVAIDLLISTAILTLILIAQGVGIAPTFVSLVPIYLVLLCWAGAFSVFVSSITVFVRDIRFLMPMAAQLLFIATPIMYPARLFPQSASWINEVNPVAVVVTATRQAAVHHAWPAWHVLGWQALAAICALVLALMYVRSVEPRMVDVA